MASKKILLVNPSQKLIYMHMGGFNPPHMGLAYIGAVLEKAGYDVKLIDMDYYGVIPEQIAKIVKGEDIETVGLTATTPVIKNALAVAKAIKQLRPKTNIVIGGVHATVMSREVICQPGIDFLVRGEGELTVVELMEAIEGRKNLKDVLGITYKQNDQIIETGARPLIDNLDEIPPPARDLFDVNQYKYPNMLYSPASPVHTSRGCPADCTFCQAKNMYGHRVRFRSAPAIAEEIEFLIRRYKIRQIDILDDNFAVNKARIFQLRDEIKHRNIKTHFSFTAGIRVDSACDESVLRAMREMGGYNIAFGIESGSQDILDKTKKGITLEQSRNAVQLAKKVGFETWAFFILGFPEDTEETMRQTISFAKELEPDIAHFHILKPYPGSQIYEEMKQNNLIENFNFEDYGMYSFPVHHTKSVSSSKIFEYQKLAYRSFYLRPKAILNQIKGLRSRNRLVSNFKSGWGILHFILFGRGQYRNN